MEVKFRSSIHDEYISAVLSGQNNDQLEALRLQMQLPVTFRQKAGETADQLLDRLIDHCADNDMLTFS